VCPAGSVAGNDQIYPVGLRFPLGLYSTEKIEDLKNVKNLGWNMVQSYNFKPDYLKICSKVKIFALANLDGEAEPLPEAQAASWINEIAKNNFVGWWNLPEERRWWRKGEMQIIKNYYKWTRRYDCLKHPNYMYIPGHYTAEAVAKYVPYLDIIPASVYTSNYQMPHAWVRWRMETTIKGIERAKAKIGRNYLEGEKTPIAVLQLFDGSAGKPHLKKLMRQEGAYHDFWQCIVSGAKGILVFSYWHKRDNPQCEKNWQAYCRAADQIKGAERIGQVILFGRKFDNLTCDIIKGPLRTEKFVPLGTKLESIRYPSVDFLSKTYFGNLYIILVNSTEQSVTAKIRGVPNSSTEANVLFQHRKLRIEGGAFDVAFAPLEVHILKIPMDSIKTSY
jgi:hypothetical protein